MRSVEDIVNKYQQPLHSFVYRKLRSHEDAADIVQETFFQAWKSRDTLTTTTDENYVGKWLFTVAYNRCIDLWRKRNNRETPMPDYFDIADRRDYIREIDDQSAFIEMISRLSGGLKGNQADLITRLYVNRDAMPEIASDLDIPIGTVKSRHWYTLKQLRKQQGEN